MLRRLSTRALAPLATSLAALAACADRGGSYPDARGGAPGYVQPAPITGGAAPGPGVSAPPLATPGSPGCAKAPARAGASLRHVTAAGQDRTFTLAVPEGYTKDAPLPLVFVLHGNGGTGAGLRAQIDLEKQSGGKALVVYPDALGGGWDLDAPASTNRDVALFDAISLTVFNELCVDSRRVFAAGFSNGAYMANQLGCRRGERLRGVVSHAGGGPYEVNGSYDAQGHLVCNGKAVAALVVHGTSDGTVPPSEGQKSIDHWSQANRCTGGAPAPALTAPCTSLAGCYQPVDVCRIPGLGHGLWKDAGKVTWQFVDGLR